MKPQCGHRDVVIKNVLSEAVRARLPVKVHVESFNPSLRLFERLRFRKTKQDDFNFLMQWDAAGREADATRNPSPNQSNQPAAGDLTEPHD